MTRTINGLAFTIHSPSLYELATINDVDDPGARVTIEFCGIKWQLVYKQGNGHKVFRVFNSRDAAIDLIASRRGEHVA